METFARSLGTQVKFDQGTPYEYRSGVWVRASDARLQKLAALALPDSIRRHSITNELRRTYEDVHGVDPHAWRSCYARDDAGTVVLNLRDGLLEVMADSCRYLTPEDMDGGTREDLDRYRRKLMFRAQLNARYDPKAECPLFNKVAHAALPDAADLNLFHWWTGYTLLPDCRARKALVCFGPSQTSKSTLWVYGIGRVFGCEPGSQGETPAVTQLDLADLQPGNYGLPALQLAALNLGSEMTSREMAESSVFKLVVCGEPLTVRAIYGKPYTLRGYSPKFIFCTNHIPMFQRGTDAEFRRLTFLHFGQVVAEAERDAGLQDALGGELDGIISTWMVPALKDILVGVPEPKPGDWSQTLGKDFRLRNEPVRAFADALCQVAGDADKGTDKASVYAAYYHWCEDNDLRPLPSNKFWMVFWRLFPGVSANKGHGQKRTVQVQLNEIADTRPVVDHESGSDD